MCFKGTTQFPLTKDIFKKYDEIGAYFNAFTDKRYTCYYIKCMDDFVKNCLFIMSDIMLNSVFDKQECKKELQVVIQENIKGEDDDEEVTSELIDSMIYRGSSFEAPVDSVKYHRSPHKSFNYETLLKIYNSFYCPKNMILSIVSNIPLKDILKMTQHTHFMSSPHRYASLLQKPPIIMKITPYTEKPMCMVRIKTGVVSNHIAISFRVCSLYDKHDRHCLEILKNIMGEIGNSLLFSLLREKNGLTYSSYVSTNYHENAGDFTITAITDPTKMLYNQFKYKKGVLCLLIDLINDLIENGVKEEDFKVAKKFMKSKFEMDLEDNDVSSLHNAEYVLFYSSNLYLSSPHSQPSIQPHPYVSYDQMYDKYYKHITIHQVNEVIKKYFRKENMNVCLLGGEHGTISKQLLKRECDKIIQ